MQRNTKINFLELKRFARRLQFKVQEVLTLFNADTQDARFHNCTL